MVAIPRKHLENARSPCEGDAGDFFFFFLSTKGVLFYSFTTNKPEKNKHTFVCIGGALLRSDLFAADFERSCHSPGVRNRVPLV